jgi:hypothetical protein
MKKSTLGIFVSVLLSVALYADTTTWTTGAYENDTDINDTLYISGASMLTVNINGKSEENYDFVTIYDAFGHSNSFSGCIDETMDVNGSTIYTRFISDYSITDEGITVSIAPPSNTTWTTGAYCNNAYKSKTLYISGANSLRVTIEGETEEGYDFITIYDNNMSQIAQFSGSINQTIDINGSTIEAVLSSDYSITDSGVTVSISD